MSEISGDFKLGFNLHQIKQGANDRFKAAFQFLIGIVHFFEACCIAR